MKEGKAVAGLEWGKKSFNTGWGRIWDNKWVVSWWKSNVWYMGGCSCLMILLRLYWRQGHTWTVKYSFTICWS